MTRDLGGMGLNPDHYLSYFVIFGAVTNLWNWQVNFCQEKDPWVILRAVVYKGGKNVTVRLVWIPGSDSSGGRAPQTRDSGAIVQIAICSVIISPISTPGTDSLTLAWGKNLWMYLQGWRSFKTPVTPELHPKGDPAQCCVHEKIQNAEVHAVESPTAGKHRVAFSFVAVGSLCTKYMLWLCILINTQ